MAIMVDEARYPFKGQMYCHMMSDLPNMEAGLIELHAFAARLGLKRSWFQPHKRHPHYDIAPSKRAAAVRMGAIEVTSRAMVFLNPHNADLWGSADSFCTNCYWYGHHSDMREGCNEHGEWERYCPRCDSLSFGSIARYDNWVPV